MTEAPAIPLAALDGRAAVIGMPGSGKTYAARGAVERLLDAGRQVVALDPTGAWWGLGRTPDGRGAGPYAVAVLGGRYGHAGLPPEAGRSVARVLLERRMSAVLDTSGMDEDEVWRFGEAFLAELNRGRAPHGLHLVVDEAHEFAPEVPAKGQHGVRRQMARMWKGGRIAGYRPLVITQRPADTSKQVLSLAEFWAVLRLMSERDRKAAFGQIEGQVPTAAEARAIVKSLPAMPTGEGWLLWPLQGPPRRVRFPPIRTLDSGRAPEAGAAAPGPLPAAGLDLDALREALAADGAEGGAAGAAPDSAPLIAAMRAENERLRAELADARRRERELAAAVKAAAGVLVPLAVEDGVLDVRRLPAPPTIDAERESAVVADPPPPKAVAVAAPSARGENAELRVLRVLVAAGRPLSAQAWALLCVMSRRGGTWGTYLSRLRSRHLIDRGGDGLYGPTEAGRRAAGAVPPVDLGEVRSAWVDYVGAGAAGRMLAALFRAFPGSLDRLELAAALGMAATGGTFGTYLSRLTAPGAAVKEGPKRVRASPDLFPPAEAAAAAASRDAGGGQAALKRGQPRRL